MLRVKGWWEGKRLEGVFSCKALLLFCLLVTTVFSRQETGESSDHADPSKANGWQSRRLEIAMRQAASLVYATSVWSRRESESRPGGEIK